MSDTSDKKISAFRFIKPVGNVVLEDSSAHHLLMFLCWAANSHTGTSWHSQYSVNSRTGMDRKTVRKATRTLESFGLITCESQGKKANLLYTVNFDKLMELAEVGKKLCAERRKLKQAGDSDRGNLPHARGNLVHDTRGNLVHQLEEKAPSNLVTNHEVLTTKEPDAGASKSSGSISGIEAKLASLGTLKNKALSDRNGVFT